MLKKVLLITGIIITALAIGLIIFANSGPSLPPQADAIIDEVLSSEPPELITGTTGMAESGEVKIWYESITPTDTLKGSILLIMGLGTTALVWPEHFYQALVDSGYQVIRYDNRGLGMSDWIENWDERNPYTLEDMANDALTVLDALEVRKAHIIGASMGGMIAQRLAISHAERVLSMTSMMSSGYLQDPELPQVPKQFELNVLKLRLRYGIPPSERNSIKFQLGLIELLKGDGGYKQLLKSNVEKAYYELRRRRGYNPGVVDQHAAAIYMSGSRYGELGKITIPTLVIHGKSDPLTAIAHAEKYASMIPGAKTLWVEGMGHDFPKIYIPQILEAIFGIFETTAVQTVDSKGLSETQ